MDKNKIGISSRIENVINRLHLNNPFLWGLLDPFCSMWTLDDLNVVDQDDYDAARSDWEQVGEDLKAAMRGAL